MRKRDIKKDTESRFFSMPELQAYLSVGESTVRKIAEASGAKIKIGRRALYDRRRIDAYIDSLGA